MKTNNIWAIVPAYNESKHISKVVKKIKRYVDNIVVVDDGSKDNTSEEAEKTGTIVLKHIVNLGKGAALKTGCEFALKKGAQQLIFIDSDGQHDPSEIPKFIEELKRADIVFGARKFNKKMPFVMKFGNNFINKSTELLYGIKLNDTQSGFRALSVEAYNKIKWRASDYSVESEMIANTGKRKLKYKEIEIRTIYSDKYKGTTVFDGIKIVFNMLLWRLRR